MNKYVKNNSLSPTDTEMLDWLQNNARGYGVGWICRDSVTGRGLRLHETSLKEASDTVREAIKRAMSGNLTHGEIKQG